MEPEEQSEEANWVSVVEEAAQVETITWSSTSPGTTFNPGEIIDGSTEEFVPDSEDDNDEVIDLVDLKEEFIFEYNLGNALDQIINTFEDSLDLGSYLNNIDLNPEVTDSIKNIHAVFLEDSFNYVWESNKFIYLNYMIGSIVKNFYQHFESLSEIVREEYNIVSYKDFTIAFENKAALKSIEEVVKKRFSGISKKNLCICSIDMDKFNVNGLTLNFLNKRLKGRLRSIQTLSSLDEIVLDMEHKYNFSEQGELASNIFVSTMVLMNLYGEVHYLGLDAERLVFIIDFRFNENLDFSKEPIENYSEDIKTFVDSYHEIFPSSKEDLTLLYEKSVNSLLNGLKIFLYDSVKEKLQEETISIYSDYYKEKITKMNKQNRSIMENSNASFGWG